MRTSGAVAHAAVHHNVADTGCGRRGSGASTRNCVLTGIRATDTLTDRSTTTLSAILAVISAAQTAPIKSAKGC